MHIIYNSNSDIDHLCLEHLEIKNKKYYEITKDIFEKTSFSGDLPDNISVLVRESKCTKCTKEYRIVENSYLFCIIDKDYIIISGYINTD